MICKREECTGCHACYNSCPKKCITMKEDEYGYIYPYIEKELCINCNLCKKVCPSLNKNKNFRTPKNVYASWSLDEKERKSSSSGGAAYIMSKYIIDNGGYVFGAAYGNELSVNHIMVKNLEELRLLKESKYLQSNIGDSYSEVKKMLQKDEVVIFIGTPCQIDGLMSYLGKEYNNLITIDIICHGVPSYKMFKEYILSKVKTTDIDKVSFRDGNDFGISLMKNNEIIFKKHFRESEYYMGFMEGLTYRDNCYKCKYAQEKRISDITLGDFWGIGESIPFKYDTKNGVSLILINTFKGKELLNNCKKELFLEERTLEEAIKKNDQLKSPTVEHKKRKKFLKIYKKEGFNKAIISCLRMSFIKYKIKKIIISKDYRRG